MWYYDRGLGSVQSRHPITRAAASELATTWLPDSPLHLAHVAQHMVETSLHYYTITPLHYYTITL